MSVTAAYRQALVDRGFASDPAQERAIAELEDAAVETMDASAIDHNPEDHSETLSPDSDEYLDRMAAEEASLNSEGDGGDELDDVLDEKEWAEGDGFEPERGVR